MSNARKGKIARLPVQIREEVNRRLLDGESGPKILRWLNEQPEVLRVLDEYFGEEPVTPQNLSEWRTSSDPERKSGYEEWLERREKIEGTKSLASFAAKMAEAAGGTVTDGSAAILGGKFLELLETADEKTDLGKITRAVVSLRMTDLEARKAKQRDKLLEQKERTVALAEKQFQMRSADLFLKFYEDKRAKDIIEGKAARPVKMESLRQLMFPTDEPLDPKPLNG